MRIAIGQTDGYPLTLRGTREEVATARAEFEGKDVAIVSAERLDLRDGGAAEAIRTVGDLRRLLTRLTSMGDEVELYPRDLVARYGGQGAFGIEPLQVAPAMLADEDETADYPAELAEIKGKR